MRQQVYVHEYVEAPFEPVVEALRERSSDLLTTATDHAVEHARRVRANLVVDVATFEIVRAVEIDIGELELAEEYRAVLSLSWEAADAPGLFPLLAADLEVAALSLDPPLTQVSLVGHYDPPLGLLGTAGDSLFGRRIAQATLHRFLKDVVERLRQLLVVDTEA